MKKAFLAMAAAVALMLVGCSKDNDSVQVSIYEYPIADADWTPWIDALYYVKLEMPQITQDVIDHGLVQVSRVMEQDGTFYYAPLPSILTDTDDDGNPMSTLIDYDYSVGEVCIYVTRSDQSITTRPGDYTFRVTITR